MFSSILRTTPYRSALESTELQNGTPLAPLSICFCHLSQRAFVFRYNYSALSFSFGKVNLSVSFCRVCPGCVLTVVASSFVSYCSRNAWCEQRKVLKTSSIHLRVPRTLPQELSEGRLQMARSGFLALSGALRILHSPLLVILLTRLYVVDYI